MLDDLTARGLIAWIREPAAIHVTVASEAEDLAPIVLERKELLAQRGTNCYGKDERSGSRSSVRRRDIP